jgi:hypothetical protein
MPHMKQAHQEFFDATTMHKLDNGLLGAMMQHAMKQCVEDIGERPADKSPRKVIITLEMKPVLDKSSGVLDHIGLEYVVDTRVPKQRTNQYPMLLGDGNRLLFNPHSPSDPRQRGLFEGSGEDDEPVGAVDDEEENDDPR